MTVVKKYRNYALGGVKYDMSDTSLLMIVTGEASAGRHEISVIVMKRNRTWAFEYSKNFEILLQHYVGIGLYEFNKFDVIYIVRVERPAIFKLFEPSFCASFETPGAESGRVRPWRALQQDGIGYGEVSPVA